MYKQVLSNDYLIVKMCRIGMILLSTLLLFVWYFMALHYKRIHFPLGTNVHEQSRSDFCRLRFQTDSFSKLYALNQHIKTPGTALYFSGKSFLSCWHFAFYVSPTTCTFATFPTLSCEIYNQVCALWMHFFFIWIHI